MKIAANIPHIMRNFTQIKRVLPLYLHRSIVKNQISTCPRHSIQTKIDLIKFMLIIKPVLVKRNNRQVRQPTIYKMIWGSYVNKTECKYRQKATLLL